MSLTIGQLQDLIARTQTARDRLADRRTEAIIAALTQTAANWLAPNSHWRARAIAEAPGPTRFSEAMVEQIVSLTFAPLTSAAFNELLERELGDRQALDEFCPRGPTRARGSGPRLITHFLAGNVPSPGINSVCFGLLVRAANLVKCSSNDPVFPQLFVESLREVDPALADCVAVLNWPRAEAAMTQQALASAEAVVAYGDDSTIAELRRLTPAGTQFLGYGQKLSFAVLRKEAVTAHNLPALAEAAAFDVSVYDQQGCLSPHIFYVEERGEISPRKFAELLAQQMDAYQRLVPRGRLSVEEAAAVKQVLEGYEFRAANDRRVAVWTSQPPGEWTVIYEDDPSFLPSCLNRTVYVKPTDGLKRVLEAVRRYTGKISTVGVAPMDEGTVDFASDLAKLGAHRVCLVGQMQRPPLAWHHDGRANLADLVRWVDLG